MSEVARHWIEINEDVKPTRRLWEDFDKENALWKLDVLGDLKVIIDYRYSKANKEYFHELEKTNE